MFLYCPLYPKFPAVDMLWVEFKGGQKSYFAVQVTFTYSHSKHRETYLALRKLIGLASEDKLTIYLITNPRYKMTYANGKCPNASFVSGAAKRNVNIDDLNIEFATITTDKFVL